MVVGNHDPHVVFLSPQIDSECAVNPDTRFAFVGDVMQLRKSTNRRKRLRLGQLQTLVRSLNLFPDVSRGFVPSRTSIG